MPKKMENLHLDCGRKIAGGAAPSSLCLPLSALASCSSQRDRERESLLAGQNSELERDVLQ